jgi:hypothetical protein
MVKIKPPVVIRAGGKVGQIDLTDDGELVAVSTKYGGSETPACQLFTAAGAHIADYATGWYGAGCAFSGGWLYYAARDRNGGATQLFRAKPKTKPARVESYGNNPERLARDPDGRFVVVLGRVADVRDAATGARVRQWSRSDYGEMAAGFMPGRPWMYLWGAEAELVVWDLDVGDPLMSYPVHTESGGQVIVSADGRWLVTVGTNAYGVEVRDTLSGERLLTDAFETKWHSTYLGLVGNVLLKPMSGLTAIQLPDGKELGKLELGNGYASAAATSRDGKVFACGFEDRSVLIFPLG